METDEALLSTLLDVVCKSGGLGMVACERPLDVCGFSGFEGRLDNGGVGVDAGADDDKIDVWIFGEAFGVSIGFDVVWKFEGCTGGFGGLVAGV